MLSDRQAIILQLLTAAVQSGKINIILSHPAEIKAYIEKAEKIADVFLEQTASPFNTVSISSHLEKNTLAMLEISSTLKEICQTFAEEPQANGSPHKVSQA